MQRSWQRRRRPAAQPPEPATSEEESLAAQDVAAAAVVAEEEAAVVGALWGRCAACEDEEEEHGLAVAAGSARGRRLAPQPDPHVALARRRVAILQGDRVVPGGRADGAPRAWRQPMVAALSKPRRLATSAGRRRARARRERRCAHRGGREDQIIQGPVPILLICRHRERAARRLQTPNPARWRARRRDDR